MTSTSPRRSAEKLGVRVEFVETPWDAMFAALEANRFDVVANEVTINDERKAKYDLSRAVLRRRRRDRDPRRRQLDQDARRPEGQGRGRERDEQLVGGGPQGRRAGRGRRGLHPGDQAAQPGPGGCRRQRQHRGVRLPRRDRRQDRQDRRERRREERAGLRRAQGQRPVARPEQGARRAAIRRHAGRDLAEIPEGRTLLEARTRRRHPMRTNRPGSSCCTALVRWPRRRSPRRFR